MGSNVVSIIIPVYNDFEALEGLIPHLLNQTVKQEHYEIFIIDNCSDFDIKVALSEFPTLRILKECEYKGSPYSCRNRGIEQATGDIIALLDSTCYPEHTWLEEALHCFDDPSVDMVAGEVGFRFLNEKPTAAEYFDSITNIKMRESVLHRNVAKTANLFVRKDVFNKVGKFEEGLRSGGDVAWTRKATEMGFSLNFCEKAVVKKEARLFGDLANKQFRVGKGQPSLWAINGEQKSAIKIILSIFKPVSWKRFRKKNGSDIKKNGQHVFNVFIVASLLRIIQRTGNLIGFLKR